MATAPSPNDLTRQQLDELDALLQRMLSVPLSPADTPAPVAPPAQSPPMPPSWRVDPPAPAPVSSPHLLLVEPPAPPAPRIEAPAPVPAPQPAPAPAPVSKSVPPAAAPAPLPPPRPVPAPLAPVPIPAPASAPVTPVPSAPPLPFFLLPLVALNALFNIICGLFGPPGRLLRSGFFKYIYGLVGVGLLLYTAAHVAQTQGWLSLPVVLPWPR